MGTTILKLAPELRNHLINGNMDFWQRGTTFNSITNGKYSADRFFYEQSGAQVINVTQSTDVPTVAQSGYQSKFSWLATVGTSAAVGSTGYTVISQKMEGQDYQMLHAKKARLQFWVKSSVTGTYPVSLRAQGSPQRSYVSTYSVPIANTWQKVSIDIQMDTIGAGTSWPLDNTVAMYITWGLSVGTSFQTSSLNTWLNGVNVFGATGEVDWANNSGATFQLAQIAMYSVTAGSGVDLPFVRAGRTIQQELAMCQRYCFRTSTDPATGLYLGSTQSVAAGQAFSTTQMFAVLHFPVQMRAVPTATFSGGAASFVTTDASGGAHSINSSALATNTMGVGEHWIAATSTSLVAGNASILYSLGGQVLHDAEL